MTSRAVKQNNILIPDEVRDDPAQELNSKGKQATVYDAVAGRISARGFIPKQVVIASTRDTASSSTLPVPPEAVLFRRKHAPTRFQESDIYFANEQGLPTDLPDSDLLKALHSYTSDFYSRANADDGTGDYRSMDETALLALGILMEEAAQEILGKTGDLALTEGEEVQQPPAQAEALYRSNSSGYRPSSKRRKIEEHEKR